MTITNIAAAERLREVFDAAGAVGFVHAREVDGPGEVCLDADEPVVLASVFKVPVALTYARQAAAGLLDRTERICMTKTDREGGIGTDGCADDVEMSWRDLALFMLTMSDNAATDVVLSRVGLDSVRADLAELGLSRTRLIGGCFDLGASMLADLGLGSMEEYERVAADLPDEAVWKLAVLDPGRTTSSTPREITTLLSLIWRDEAGPPEACAEVRSLMGRQIWPHRLTAGFPDDVAVAGKTGTLPAVRNEVGVVTYPDGSRYAVAVFTRARSLAYRQPAVDAAIGAAARCAVDLLRA